MRTLKALRLSFAALATLMIASVVLLWAADSNFWWGGEAYQFSRHVERWTAPTVIWGSVAFALVSLVMCTTGFAQSLRFGVITLILTVLWTAVAYLVGLNVHSWTMILVVPTFFTALSSMFFFLHTAIKAVRTARRSELT